MSVVETPENAIDHAATLVIAVAIRQFHGLIEGNRGWCGEVDEINNRQSQDVSINARQAGEAPTLHHSVETGIDAGALLQHQANPLKSRTPDLVLVTEQEQTRQLHGGGQTIQNLLGRAQ